MWEWLSDLPILIRYLLFSCLFLALALLLFQGLEWLHQRAGALASWLALAGLLMISSGLFADRFYAATHPVQKPVTAASATGLQRTSAAVAVAATPQSIAVSTAANTTDDLPTNTTAVPNLPAKPVDIANPPVVTYEAAYHADGINALKRMLSADPAEPAHRDTAELTSLPDRESCRLDIAAAGFRPLQTIAVDWESRRLSRYDHLFRQYTQRYFGASADWRWFKVQAFVESNLNPSAKSSAGAVGLMQVLPGTFSQIQRMDRSFRGKSLMDPETNIAAGIYYNKYLMKNLLRVTRTDKRLPFMFASYNAGINRVTPLFTRHDVDSDDLTDITRRLPGETRRYLRKLSHHMQEYRGVAFVWPAGDCEDASSFDPLMVAMVDND